jgi:hypothetical protein
VPDLVPYQALLTTRASSPAAVFHLLVLVVRPFRLRVKLVLVLVVLGREWDAVKSGKAEYMRKDLRRDTVDRGRRRALPRAEGLECGLDREDLLEKVAPNLSAESSI